MDISMVPAMAKALDDLYAAIRGESLTEDAYALAGTVIESVNSAEYSAWEWRWRCFVVLDAEAGKGKGTLVEMERALMRRVATSNPKNYQLWNHRRRLAMYCRETLMRDAAVVLAGELEFTQACLQVDTKNYHAWGHRQAMIKAFATQDELETEFVFVTSMLERDVMNNSAWSQRAFLMDLKMNMGSASGATGVSVRTWDQEFAETTAWVEQCVENEASWTYLAHVVRSGLTMGNGDNQAAYAEFLARMLKSHPTSIEAGAAAFAYYKWLRDVEEDEAQRAAWTDMMRMIRDRLVALDGRRARRWDVWLQ